MTDREAIIDAIYRYCRAMDRIDVELGRSIWHPDGTADYGPGRFSGNGHEFVDRVCKIHAELLTHSHQVTNIIVELAGDRAASESCCTATLRMMRDDVLTQITVWSRYIDTWSRREGRWAIDHRQTVIDFDEIRPVTAMSHDDVARRDRSDPSYVVLGTGA